MTNEESSDGNTRIDLGEDLLDKTAVSIEVPHPLLTPTSSVSTTDFESARILLNEGMAEEAKKILRKLLITNPSYVAAKDLLAEIHEQELKEIFSGASSARKNYAKVIPDSTPPSDTNPDTVIQSLDADHQLGILPALLRSDDTMNELITSVDAQLPRMEPHDHIDLGVGFMEMTLYPLAHRQFDLARQAATSPDDLLSATTLLAYSYILASKPFDAISCLQSLLNDPEVAIEDKIELFYLMGRSNELIRKSETARTWYEHAAQIDPYYRDIQERLRRLHQ